MKQFKLIGFLTLALLVGCSASNTGSTGSINPPTGGGNPPTTGGTTPPPPPATVKHQFAVKANGGGSLFLPNRTQAKMSLPGPLRLVAAFIGQPEANDTSTPSGIAMSFNGYFQGVSIGGSYPVGFIAPPTDPLAAPAVPEYAATGMGTFDTTGSNQIHALTAKMGAPVVGDGTLSILRVVLAQPLQDTSGVGLPVWIYVNGQPTAITCVIPVGGTTCSDNTNTATVSDGDSVVAGFAEYSAADNTSVQNLQVLLGKS